MSYLVLSRKYRPQNFDEVVGQSHITQTLKNAVESRRIAHAYLFSGPRGIGKTSTARILAKCLNCEKGPTVAPCGKCVMCREITDGISMDILEIDAASHTKVEEIRDLIEKVRYVSGASRYKMYIIDEVHMLSDSSFNALLKTVEEPPPNVIFVLATTAPHDVPQTIVSRCQWFVFKRILTQDMITHLQGICKAEGVKISDSSLYAIAKHSEGSLRDSEVSLEQVMSFSGNNVNDEDVNALLGIIKLDFLKSFFRGILERDVLRVVGLVGEIMDSGYEVDDFIKGLQEYIRNLIVLKDSPAKNARESQPVVDLPDGDVKELRDESALFSEAELVWMLEAVSRTQKDLHNFGLNGQERLILELMAIRMAKRDLRQAVAKEQEFPARSQQVQQKPQAVAVTAPAPAQAAKAQERPAEANPPEEKAKAPAPARPAHGGLSADTALVIRDWSLFVGIMKEKKPALASFFEHSRPRELKGDVVTVLFSKDMDFQRTRAEERENREFIESSIAEVFGKRLKLDYVPEVREQVEEKRSEEDPLVKKTMQMFNAKTVERKKIDKGEEK